jgi:hypothetical protein
MQEVFFLVLLPRVSFPTIPISPIHYSHQNHYKLIQGGHVLPMYRWLILYVRLLYHIRIYHLNDITLLMQGLFFRILAYQ